jgi:hypothetical protein
MIAKLSKICSECPRKNPVEDIWLQTKNFMIAFYHLCSSFKIVKWLFNFFADGQMFDFPKLFQYGILPQPPRGLLYISTYCFKLDRLRLLSLDKKIMFGSMIDWIYKDNFYVFS